MSEHRTSWAAIRPSVLGLGWLLAVVVISAGCQSEPGETVGGGGMPDSAVEESPTSSSVVAAPSDPGEDLARLAEAGEGRTSDATGDPSEPSDTGRIVSEGSGAAIGSDDRRETNLRGNGGEVRELSESVYVDFGSVPEAEMGDELGTSRLAALAGYESADDPERHTVLAGRRDAPWVDGDLEGSVRGFDRLIDQLMLALDDLDQRGLTYLRISGHDYEKFCWPEFPQSRPVTNIPVNESWLFLERKCHSGMTAGLNEWGGRGLTPLRVEFRDGRADYRNFTMWKGMVIYARQPGSDVEVAIDFAEVVIERNGLWKVYAFED